jgi:hypothetical protein
MSIFDPESWSRESREEHLSEDEVQELALALERWASVNPLANRPLLYLGQFRVAEDEASEHGLTPHELGAALRNEDSPLHKPVLRLFEVGLSGYSGGITEAVRQMLDTLDREAQQWARNRNG